MFGKGHKDDVFVIGPEFPEAETGVLEHAEPCTRGDQEPESNSQLSGLGRRVGDRGRNRLLASLALAGGGLLALLALTSANRGSDAEGTASSAPADPASRPAPRAVVPPAHSARLPPPHRDPRPKRHREIDHAPTQEPAREPIDDEAPASSPVTIAVAPAPPPATPAPVPPSPSSGGGAGGTEEFGFER